MEAMTATPGSDSAAAATISSPPPAPSIAPNQLYDAILHSIYAFTNLSHDDYEDFFSQAQTCKTWYQAGATMRFPHQIDYTSTSYHYDIDFVHMSRAPLRVALSSFCYNHHHVRKLKTSLFSHLVNEIEIGERFSHLHRLELPILLHHSEPYDLSAAYEAKKSNLEEKEKEKDVEKKEVRKLMFRLPFQLRSLIVVFQLVDHSKFTVSHEDEETVTEGQEEGNVVRTHVYGQINRVMEMMNQAIRASGCKYLYRLECKLAGRKSFVYHHLPAAALRPIAHVKTVTHLLVRKPTLQCCDVIRTMQIKQLDGLINEVTLFRRLVDPDAARRPILPPLQKFCLEYSDTERAALCAYFTTITDLRLEDCKIDPGQVLLSQLPHLQRFAFIVGPRGVQFVPAQVLLDGIARYASQLSHLQFGDHEMTEEHLSKFLPKMTNLTSLCLSYCPVITRLDFLKSAPQLKELYLDHVDIVSREELEYAKHIAKVELIDVFDDEEDEEEEGSGEGDAD